LYLLDSYQSCPQLQDLKPKKSPVPTPFLSITIKNSGLRGDNMAKSHYSFQKRKKELARKLKQEEKRKRKLDKDSIEPEEASDKSEDEVKNSLT